MGEGKGSTLVHIVVVALSLTAFGFAIAAERRRSTVSALRPSCFPLYFSLLLGYGKVGFHSLDSGWRGFSDEIFVILPFFSLFYLAIIWMSSRSI